MSRFDTNDFIALIHLVGFITGVVLYGMLAVMAWRGRAPSAARADVGTDSGTMPVLAALLGLIWNAGALLAFGWHDFKLGELSPWLMMFSYAALGFLPAVVVDSATRAPQPGARPAPIALAAYALSAAGAAMQMFAIADYGVISSAGLKTLTLGYAAILVAVAATSRRRTGSQRAVTAIGLAAFAVSALHLSRHTGASDSWFVELIGHHASLPLVLVILYQDYRFAFADLFLKRAIAFLALVAVVFTCYGLLMPLGGTSDGAAVGTPGALLAAWIGTALMYPALRRAVNRFVDRIVLQRVDYRALRTEISAALAAAESPEGALSIACDRLSEALTATGVAWDEVPSVDSPSGSNASVTLYGSAAANVVVPTVERPSFTVSVAGLAKGRRLLSDDISLLESVAVLVARRIDELRVARERLERDVRESDMQRLAAEAELRALRAQLNPHFLFNALTTIGYLIRSSPPRALDTLYQLTALLRSVLRGSTGEFVTVKEEMGIVDAYLAIEQARFEDRLVVERSIADDIQEMLIPPLVLQPVVENAIKHGIAPQRAGGTVRIDARVVSGCLVLRVSDTGPGLPPADFARRRTLGVGLSNLERRLQRYFNGRGSLTIESTAGVGTVVELILPGAA